MKVKEGTIVIGGYVMTQCSRRKTRFRNVKASNEPVKPQSVATGNTCIFVNSYFKSCILILILFELNHLLGHV